MEYTVSFPGLDVNGLHVKPELFRIFGVPIYWYGVLIAVAVLLGMSLALRHSKRYGIKQDDILDCLLAAVPAAIVFARLYYVIFSWETYRENLWLIFDTRAGGLAFYGAVIGAILAVLTVCAFKKISALKMADFLILYIPLGQAIGRWGNFFNQEAFGTNTDLPWGMYSNGTRDYLASLNLPGLNPDKPVHPTFLYEFIGNLLIFVVLLFIRRQSKKRAEVIAWYLFLYGTLRFFVESIRTDALMVGQSSLRVSLLLSALMVLGAMLTLAFLYFWPKHQLALETEEETVSEPGIVSEAEIKCAVANEFRPVESAENAEGAENAEVLAVQRDEEEG